MGVPLKSKHNRYCRACGSRLHIQESEPREFDEESGDRLFFVRFGCPLANPRCRWFGTSYDGHAYKLLDMSEEGDYYGNSVPRLWTNKEIEQYIAGGSR
jgi:hypothetical protein